MIGETIPEEHARRRADLADSVGRFLAQGGQIKQCTKAGSEPRQANFQSHPEHEAEPNNFTTFGLSSQSLQQNILVQKNIFYFY